MRVRAARTLLPLLLCFFSVATYGQTTATWTDANGNWSNSANWSTCAPAACPAVPANGGGNYYDAVINGTGSDTIAFDASGTVVNSLSLGTGETLQDNGKAPTLTIGDPTFPAAGSLTNNGTINWGSGANLVLDITSGNGSITNNGAINLTASTLTIQDGGNGNTAALSGSGTLTLAGGTITGASGDETFVNGSGSTIQGSGTISNLSFVNDGTLNVNGTAPLTIDGSYTSNTPFALANVTGSGGLVINGTVNDIGMMNVNASTLTVKGDFNQTLAAFGLTLEDGSVGSITGSLTLNYSGSISVDQSVLTVKGDFTNGAPSGLVSVTDGSTLKVGGDVLNNGDIAIFVLSGGSSALVGGNFTESGFGGYTQVNASSLVVQGNYENDAYGSTEVENAGTLTVAGNLDSEGPPGGFYISPGSLLTVAGNATSEEMVADGTVLVDGGFTNGANGFSESVLNVGGAMSVGGGFTNATGTVTVATGGILNAGSYSQSAGLTDVSGTLTTGAYTQSGGSTTVESGGVVSASSFKATGGSVTVNGTLDPTAMEFDSGSVLQGMGKVVGNVSMGGTIVPGSTSAPGSLTILGNYEQTGTGIFDEVIGGSANGVLNVTGNVTLDSGAALDITLLSGFDPSGDSFTILDDGDLSGAFANGSNFDADGYDWTLTYGANDVVLTAGQAVSTPEPATLALLGAGVLGLAGFSWRKKRARQS